MTDAELDTVYTRLCKTISEQGEANASLFLARFALLAIQKIGAADIVEQLINEAGEGMAG